MHKVRSNLLFGRYHLCRLILLIMIIAGLSASTVSGQEQFITIVSLSPPDGARFQLYGFSTVDVTIATTARYSFPAGMQGSLRLFVNGQVEDVKNFTTISDIIEVPLRKVTALGEGNHSIRAEASVRDIITGEIFNAAPVVHTISVLPPHLPCKPTKTGCFPKVANQPTFGEWIDSQWAVQFDDPDEEGGASNQRAFGITAKNGEKKNLTDDRAFLRAFSTVDAVVGKTLNTIQTLTASRRFSLSGDRLWQVTLQGVLRGGLATDRGPSPLPRAEVEAEAKVMTYDGLEVLSIRTFEFRDNGTDADFSGSEILIRAASQVLPAGDYEITAVLRTQASVPGRGFRDPDASADFFFQGKGWDVGISAAPRIETDASWRAIGPVGNLEGRRLAEVGQEWESGHIGWNSNTGFDDSAAAGWTDTIFNAQEHPPRPELAFVWVDDPAGDARKGATPAYFRKEFELDEASKSGRLTVLTDDDSQVYLNGNLVLNDQDRTVTLTSNIGITPHLRAGTNLIAVKAHDSFGIFEGLYVLLRAGPQELVNGLVSFVQEDPSRFTTDTGDRVGCPEGYVGKFLFNARLTNTSDEVLGEIQVEIQELTNGNLLLTSEDLVLMGTGDAAFVVPREGGYEDGQLRQAEFVDVPFTVCLKNTNPFRFFVNVLAVKR